MNRRSRIEALEARYMTAPSSDGRDRLLTMLEAIGARCGDQIDPSTASPAEVAAFTLCHGLDAYPGLRDRVAHLAATPGPVGKLFAGLEVTP